MKLSEIVAGYMENLPAGLVVSEQAVTRALKSAVRFFCGFAAITSVPMIEGQIHAPVDGTDSIDGAQDFDLSPSEYAIIKPLFDLYVERENAMHLEASRGLGVDVFGRQVSEIAQEIAMREQEMPKAAFWEPPFTL